MGQSQWLVVAILPIGALGGGLLTLHRKRKSPLFSGLFVSGGDYQFMAYISGLEWGVTSNELSALRKPAALQSVPPEPG